MKSLFQKAFIICSLLFAAQSSFAASWWLGSVSAFNGTTLVDTIWVNGHTFRQCETQRMIAIANYHNAGYTTTGKVCSPLKFEIPLLYEEPKLKFPPECLVCGPLTLEDLKDKYTIDPDIIKGVMEEYQIERFNKEFSYLLEKYDVQGFETRLMEEAINLQNQ